MSFVEVDISGVADVKTMLHEFEDPQFTKRSQRATKAAAQVFAAPLRAAVGTLSKRMAASVYVHIAKREKPAYVVGHHRSKAFFWPFLIGGTKAHSLRPRRGATRSSYPYVRGIEPHPVVDAVANAYGNAAYSAFLADIKKDA